MLLFCLVFFFPCKGGGDKEKSPGGLRKSRWPGELQSAGPLGKGPASPGTGGVLDGLMAF